LEFDFGDAPAAIITEIRVLGCEDQPDFQISSKILSRFQIPPFLKPQKS
jgi:hypothetical protein